MPRAGSVADPVRRARVQRVSTFTRASSPAPAATSIRAITGAIGALRGPETRRRERSGDGHHRALPTAGRRRGRHPARMERKEIIIGFGHPVYTIGDPRNPIIKSISKRKLCRGRQQPSVRRVRAHRDADVGLKKMFPNLDWYSAIARIT
jgi:2-methylcitrate synthase